MPMFNVILSLDTAQYASGDLLADTQLVGDISRSGKEAVLDSIQVEDDDDQGGALDLIFLNSNRSLGTENSAPNISDANALANIIGQVSIAAADFNDLGGTRIADKVNLNIPLPTLTLYIGAISKGTSTYSASGLKVRLGIRYR